MKSLIIGKGEIGSALYEVVKGIYDTTIRDVDSLEVQGVEVLHICFPDSPNFVDYVNDYKKQYKPILTIIHSSIGVGKTQELGTGVVYSPMRGRHPKLVREIKSFVKFVGGFSSKDVELAKTYLEVVGFEVMVTDNPSTLELVKLLSNIHMGLECAWAQEVKRILEYFEGDHKTYLAWESTYNGGYKTVGDEHLIRPIMNPKPIGGHCILECTDILSKQFPSLAFDFIKESNDKTLRGDYAGVA